MIAGVCLYDGLMQFVMAVKVRRSIRGSMVSDSNGLVIQLAEL